MSDTSNAPEVHAPLGVRPGVIVVGAPCRNHTAGMAQRREQVFV